MRWIFLIFLSYNCVRNVAEPPSVNFPFRMLDGLKSGFEFKWELNREKDGIHTHMNTEGFYRGNGKFNIDGKLIIGDIVEPIGDIDPYREIKNLTGRGDFEFAGYRNGNYIYHFTANLSILSPGGKFGKGEMIIDSEGVRKITAGTEDINWEMVISPLRKLPEASIELENEDNLDIIKRRMEYYTESIVKVKGSSVYFEKKFPVRKNGFLFRESDYSIYTVIHVPVGEFLLSPDSIEYYDVVNELDIELRNVYLGEDERGGYLITLYFNNPVVEDIIGIFIDNELIGIGPSGGSIFSFSIKNEIIANEVYSVLKVHSEQLKN